MWGKLQQRLKGLVSDDIGIDLGTANTLVYVRGRGIVINEPTVVAVNQKTGQVVAVGTEAKRMLGRTPEHIVAVRPLVEGVISDFEVAEEFLAHLIRRVQEGKKRLFGPRVVIGVPFGTTNVERRAVRDATLNAGAREVHVVEQPMAAAIGIRLPIDDASGSMVVDIGGGTTDITVMSLNGVVNGKNIKVAGDRLNQDIMSYIRDEFKILIGERTAEDLKIQAGSILAGPIPIEVTVRGRDLVTGLPREVIVTDADVREAIAPSIDALVEAIKEVLETTPPEILSDVMRRGVYLVGGGALIRGFDQFLQEWLKIPVYIADDPLTSVARGTGVVLEDMERFGEIIIDEEHALPPKL
jgi:rod shape-determining protein MreB